MKNEISSNNIEEKSFLKTDLDNIKARNDALSGNANKIGSIDDFDK